MAMKFNLSHTEIAKSRVKFVDFIDQVLNFLTGKAFLIPDWDQDLVSQMGNEQLTFWSRWGNIFKLLVSFDDSQEIFVF